MEIKQIINNNVVISADNKGAEVIVVGKGIGFNRKKGDIICKSNVFKTFTLKDESDKSRLNFLVEQIPYDCIVFGEQVIEYIEQRCSKKLSKRLFLTLVDHIYTTLERYR